MLDDLLTTLTLQDSNVYLLPEWIQKCTRHSYLVYTTSSHIFTAGSCRDTPILVYNGALN